jgi:hypothetical protein
MAGNAGIEALLGSVSEFVILRNYLNMNANIRDRYAFNRLDNETTRYFQYNVSAQNVSSMRTYYNNWRLIKTVDNELSNFSEQSIREGIQPSYANLADRKTRIENELPVIQEQLSTIQKEAKYEFGHLLLGIVITIVSFLLYIWIIGLIVELLFAMVDLADDVHHLRKGKDIREHEEKQNKE